MGKEDKSKQMGTPSKYKKEYVNLVYKLALMGLDDKRMSNVLDISPRTFNNWKSKHPDFLQSIRKGKELADAEIVQSLYKVARGHKVMEVTFDEVNLSDGSLVGFDIDEMSTYDMLNLGQLLGVTSATIKIKQVSPNANAAFRLLANRHPDLWRLNPDNKPTEDPLEGTEIVFQYHVGDGKYLDQKGIEALKESKE